MLRRNFLQMLGLGAAVAPAAPALAAGEGLSMPGLVGTAAQVAAGELVEAGPDYVKRAGRLTRALSYLGSPDWMEREKRDFDDQFFDKIDMRIDCLKSVSINHKRLMQRDLELRTRQRCKRYQFQKQLAAALLGKDDDHYSDYHSVY